MKRELKKPLQFPRSNLEEKNKKNNDDILPFISTYSPNNSNAFPKVKEKYGNIQTLKSLDKIFAKHTLIKCKRQPLI